MLTCGVVSQLYRHLLSPSSTFFVSDYVYTLQGTINRLEQEKGKLENYAKRTLTAFKDKYMAALQGMKQEKRGLEERLASVTAKAEHNQETSRREERLLISAMYEVRTVTGVTVWTTHRKANFIL